MLLSLIDWRMSLCRHHAAGPSPVNERPAPPVLRPAVLFLTDSVFTVGD